MDFFPIKMLVPILNAFLNQKKKFLFQILFYSQALKPDSGPMGYGKKIQELRQSDYPLT
jgi:hypothetical protein